ncbi:hypothetical protein J2I47_00285 [Fibrella sp. HMF5335]|uniref:Oligosaccharide repeat unit polymerase n=1 Tax=Fibrella rubiginis TaxID=2817060 RepID=A0A939GE01_9BACT|nr:hypothetical protein [Fibrella rubiginis]MBO0934971.1 hypothetical protein [Fibrella rubiginis]
MTSARLRFAIISMTVIMLLLFTSDISAWEATSLGFSLFTLLTFLYELGRSIAVRELIVLITTLTMVFSPVMVLLSRPEEMILSSDEYLSYGLPATIAFSTGILLRLHEVTPHKDLLESVRAYLEDKQKTITVLLVLGITGSVLVDYMPVEIRAVVYLFAVCLYTSVLYSHYSAGKSKQITLAIALGVLIYNTVREGMFGALLYFTALYLCIVLVSRKTVIAFYYKLVLVGLCALFIILVQSIKMEYRMKTWGNTIADRKADPALMLSLVGQRLSNTDFLFGKDHLYSTYNRTNQGQLISETMSYVPRVEPYANGEIFLYFIYPFIPRFIWPNKPITGGVANIERFTRIVHNGASSSNISPLGEAYANFGRTGGIIFMFFFGLLFNLCFHKILRIAETKPTVLLWIPCLFAGCLTLETDVLTVWGSFAIMSTFLILFWIITKRLNIQL